MAFKLTDLLKNISLFPSPSVSRLEKFTKPEYGGLLSEEDVKSAQAQANLSGLLTTALGAYAAPKTKRAGSILPYLAEAYVTKGMPTAGNVGDVALSSVIQGQKFKQIGKTNELTKQLLQDPRVKGNKARELLAYTDASALAKQLDEVKSVRKDTELVQMQPDGTYKAIYQGPKSVTKGDVPSVPSQSRKDLIENVVSKKSSYFDQDYSDIYSDKNLPDFSQRVEIYQKQQAEQGRSLTAESAVSELIEIMKQNNEIVAEEPSMFGNINWIYKPKTSTTTTTTTRKPLSSF